MTEKEYNEKQEEIQKELKAILKMQNYLDDALKRLRSIDSRRGTDIRYYPNIDDTIKELAGLSFHLVKAELALIRSYQ